MHLQQAAPGQVSPLGGFSRAKAPCVDAMLSREQGNEIPHWKYPKAHHPQPRMSDLPRGEKYPIGNTPKPLWLGLVGSPALVQVATAEPRHIGTAAAARAAGAELPQHPLPVGPPWGICNKYQIK